MTDVGQLAAESGATIERILQCFERQARTIGPRGVVIAELVKELGISTRTLYRVFANKSEIVEALMKSWAAQWLDRQNEGLEAGLDPRRRIERAALNWLEHHSRFSEQFWLQLQRDFPAAHLIYEREYQLFLERSRVNLTPEIRFGLNPDLALSSLMAMIANAGDSDRCDQLNITRRDALVEVVDLWARGALQTSLSTVDPISPRDGEAGPTKGHR